MTMPPMTARNESELCADFAFQRYQPFAAQAYSTGRPLGTAHDLVEIFTLPKQCEMVVAIAGSNDRQDWSHPNSGSLRLEQVKVTTEAGVNAYVHAGYLHAARFIGRDLSEQISHWISQPHHAVTCVGHSRGGAIAQLIPTVMGLPEQYVKAVSFGSPMVFSQRCRRLPIHDILNFRHWADLVPLTPVVSKLLGRYMPVGIDIELGRTGGLTIQEAKLPTAVGRILRDIRLYVYHRDCGRKAVLEFLAGQITLSEIGGSVLQSHSIDNGYSIQTWAR